MSRKGIVESIAFLGGAPVRLLHGIHCPLLLV
jgi:nucleotide-binding universal stress UspA family protein